MKIYVAIKNILFLLFFIFVVCFADNSFDNFSKKVIENILIEGNKYVKKEAILKRLPYKVGDLFDSNKSQTAINNLYSFGSFRQVSLEIEDSKKGGIVLYVVLEEKKILEKVEFKGNKAIREGKIKEKLNLTKLIYIDEESLQRISIRIKELYKEENYHLVSIKTELEPDKKNPDKVTAKFFIKEGPKSSLKRVFFVGNKKIPERKLRNAAITKENWLLSFTDNAGVYQEEMVEMDQHKLEHFYRDFGFLDAKIYDTKVEFVGKNRDISVTFFINEGDCYTVRKISAPGDEIFQEKELLPLVSLEKGKPYSETKLIYSINRLKDLWGEKGYIYTDVYPQVIPDEKTHTVDITFYVERGNKMYVNRINITGNKVTRDKIIRRQFDIVEGDLITSKKLNKSKDRVEYLAFFEREGIDWKIHRITDNLADLEMMVKEAKTGNFNFMLAYGAEEHSSKQSLKGSVSVEKANLFGLGYDIGGLVQGDRHHLRRLEFHFFDPHILDTNFSGGYYLYKRWDEYERWSHLDKEPIQKVLGVDLRFGVPVYVINKYTNLILDLCVEDIHCSNIKIDERYKDALGPIVRRNFQNGTLKCIGLDLVQDTRNHPIYPSSGYKVTLGTKMAPAGINRQFDFFKTEIEGSCYTALIGKDSLVLGLRAKAGRIFTLDNKKNIPYKELYHIGGQATVRGFTWSGIGPAWQWGEPLGSRNALLFSTELTFPLIEDYSIKGHVFYDSGAGWDTPKKDIINTEGIRQNSFNLRHSVGFGLNLIKPIPAKIDWGFKLDRKKGETPHEFHLSMNYAW